MTKFSNMIRCIAIDDEPLALELISQLCAKLDYVKLLATFSKVSDAQKFLKQEEVDLIFLDINMPDMNGFDFYNSIGRSVLAIFTTAHSEYAIEGFNVNAVDYLLKPLQYERFVKACEKVKNTLRLEHEIHPYIYVRSDYALVKVLLNDVLYVETYGDYVKIHMADARIILTLMSMKKIEEMMMSSNLFIRIHRSYLVALKRISAIRAKSIFLGEKALPIGISFEENVMSKFVG